MVQHLKQQTLTSFLKPFRRYLLHYLECNMTFIAPSNDIATGYKYILQHFSNSFCWYKCLPSGARSHFFGCTCLFWMGKTQNKSLKITSYDVITSRKLAAIVASWFVSLVSLVCNDASEVQHEEKVTAWEAFRGRLLQLCYRGANKFWSERWSHGHRMMSGEELDTAWRQSGGSNVRPGFQH